MSGFYPILLLQENNQERNETKNNLKVNCAITIAAFK